MSRTHSVCPGRLAITAISQLFVDRFGRSVRFCNIEFDENAISDELIFGQFLGNFNNGQRKVICYFEGWMEGWVTPSPLQSDMVKRRKKSFTPPKKIYF